MTCSAWIKILHFTATKSQRNLLDTGKILKKALRDKTSELLTVVKKLVVQREKKTIQPWKRIALSILDLIL